jgi:hypothetical protein
MAIRTFPKIPDFPAFTTSLQGLVKLKTRRERSESDRRISNFKSKVPNQPSFLIKKEFWKKLANGENNSGSWLPTGYEVYAFAFCIAFDKHKVTSNPIAYFRVRTILKEIGVKAKNKKLSVLVEVDNIAYVDWDTALSNVTKTPDEKANCLFFIDKNNPSHLSRRNRIDEEIVVKPTSSIPTINPYNSNIPNSFKDLDSDKKMNSIIQNEGSIFGKNGIWNKLLSAEGKYNFNKDTTISLTWNDVTNHISLDIKINDQYGVDSLRDCPFPNACPQS